MRAICDSSTIIALERINHLWILEKFAEKILIPPAVNKELHRRKGFSLSFFIGEDIYIEALILSGEI